MWHQSHSLLHKFFPYRSFLGHIWRDHFLIGILLSSVKRGGQDISLHRQSWAANNSTSKSSTYSISFSFNGVNLLMVSALGHALRTPHSAPTKSPFVDTCQWKPTSLTTIVSLCPVALAVNLCLRMNKNYFYPYQETKCNGIKRKYLITLHTGHAWRLCPFLCDKLRLGMS